MSEMVIKKTIKMAVNILSGFIILLMCVIAYMFIHYEGVGSTPKESTQYVGADTYTVYGASCVHLQPNEKAVISKYK